jgi:BirA family biotin operon repressor/biotin-[acetyl-CoA-carboxylase] ligase
MAEFALEQRLLLALQDARPMQRGVACRALECTEVELAAAVAALRAFGLAMLVNDTTLCLEAPINLIEAAALRCALTPAATQALKSIEVLWTTDSTNLRLHERWKTTGDAHGQLLLAEFQTSGRGRQNRPWVAPLAGGLCMSLGWRVTTSVQQRLGTLGIAAGIAAMRALRAIQIDSVMLKWPNDLVVGQHKLGGILVESRHCANAIGLVIGLGLNVDLRGFSADVIDQPYTDLFSCTNRRLNRSTLAAGLASALVAVLEEWESDAAVRLIDEWMSFDGTNGKRVRISTADGTVTGTASGIDREGALLIECAGQLQRFHAGEVSLREDN